MATTNQTLPTGFNISNAILELIRQVSAEISPIQWVLIVAFTFITVIIYQQVKIDDLARKLDAIIIFHETNPLVHPEKLGVPDKSFGDCAKETAKVSDRVDELEKDLRRLRVLYWGHQAQVGKFIDCLSKRMDVISARVGSLQLELDEDSESVIHTPTDRDGDEEEDETLDGNGHEQDERVEAARDVGHHLGDPESEQESYDEDAHEAEMAVQVEAELEAELQAGMETEMYPDEYLTEEEEERQRSVSRVEEYLRQIPDAGEMNNDKLELERILGGEQDVQPQDDISSFELDPVNDGDVADDEREETDSRENSDGEED